MRTLFSWTRGYFAGYSDQNRGMFAVSGAKMKVGIVSDSHDSQQKAKRAAEIFTEHKVDYIFHAGDITSPHTAEILAAVDGAKLIAVFGNCDRNRFLLADTIRNLGGEIYEPPYTGNVAGKRIFMTHIPNMLDEVAGSGLYDLVIYGHTHKQDIRTVAQTLVINPGQSRSWFGGGAQVVILDTDDMATERISLA